MSRHTLSLSTHCHFSSGLFIYKQEEKHILTLNLRFYFKVCILIIFSVLIDNKILFLLRACCLN